MMFLPARACGLSLLLVALVGSGCAGRERPAPPADLAPAPADPRTKLDDALALASKGQYDAAVSSFEDVRRQSPEAVSALDGLKFVVVYAETGDLAKHLELTRWLVDRYRDPKTATDAERSVKGYIVYRNATDPELVAHAVRMTQFASDRAMKDGDEAHQGFFDTSRGVAAYRAGRFAESAKWLAKTTGHQSLYVRTLSLPFLAMTELARRNRTRADDLANKARAMAADLPKPGTDTYAIEWTDTLVSRMVLHEMEDTFAKARR